MIEWIMQQYAQYPDEIRCAVGLIAFGVLVLSIAWPMKPREIYYGPMPPFGPTSDFSRIDWHKDRPTWLHFVGISREGKEVWDNAEKYLTRDQIEEQQKCGRFLGMDPSDAKENTSGYYV